MMRGEGPLARGCVRLEPYGEPEAAFERRKLNVFVEYNVVVTLIVAAAVIGTVMMVGTVLPLGDLSTRALRLIVASR